jgi:hypothetical protein
MTWMRSSTLATAVSAVALTGSMACSKPGADAAAGGGAAAPAASSAAAERKLPGAETPEALVERMKAGAAKEDFGEIAACLTPKNRTEMAMAMYMGATMMVAFADMAADMGGAMADGMAGMAEPAGGLSAEAKAQAEEQKAKAKEGVATFKASYDKLVTKYGLPAIPKEGEPEKPEPTKEELEKLFANLDHGAFLTDALAVMKAMPGDHADEDASPVKIPEAGLTNLKIDGDRATGNVAEEVFTFVKIDGRWYVDEMPQGGGDGVPGGSPDSANPGARPGGV